MPKIPTTPDAVMALRPAADPDAIDFGDIPEAIDDLLQQGVAAYRKDAAAAERLFNAALAKAPEELAVYFCLYKIHAYRGNFPAALAMADAGLKEAARQAGWDADWTRWPSVETAPSHAARFALYTLKALAFINLRHGTHSEARRMLAALALLDPRGAMGWPVVAALADAVA